MMNSNSKELTFSEIKDDISKLGNQFALVLPEHISPEKFTRIIFTAMQRTPDLGDKDIDRPSLYVACMEAAQDGLMPDGKEAALIIYNTNKGSKQRPEWVKCVQYNPMIQGLRKKALMSKHIKKWDIRVVKQNDLFDYQLGDVEFIKHKPVWTDRGQTVAVYSIAVLSNGEVSREVMMIDALEDIRNMSKNSGNAIWSGKVSRDEMYRKTVGHRHYKVLPHDKDVDQFMDRFEKQFDLDENPAVELEDDLLPTVEEEAEIIEGELEKEPTPPLAKTHPPINGQPDLGEIAATILCVTNEDDLTSALSCINDLKGVDFKVRKGLMEKWKAKKAEMGAQK